ncbi:multi-sensor hybrid histidine kinase [Ancylobacter novellus DSM 506]|uniref:histidine kinase n=1 Tax=Ancylobacter novellus (strain ATCC 8093 / DSM 506 / JCM 20403 / CCM 1077 / IAM 12100 / NBRC 12443 / NCIMB 10456) TaxID=639283 RepID=D7A004_ANCN5|nr:hybrid sensor histidine kinase/response regulator [Ancylobacter novellus]ADH87418.1 multi-sensor hybrid histidine kinase [Ancylobacter novellus DSM 506]
MLQAWTIIAVALVYIGFLFAVASFGDRRLPRSRRRGRPYIYSLSLAVYCTSWTFFGSVGLATTQGVNFLTIYIGPIFVFALGTPFLLRMVRLAKGQNITSIADFVAARYGKSQGVAALVACVAIVGSLPYIALQLKAVSASLLAMLGDFDGLGLPYPVVGDLALTIAVAMAVFAVLFGTRHIDATEHQEGLMLAVATESIVKLVSFLAVGLFVVFGMFSGPFDLLDQAAEKGVLPVLTQGISVGSWAAMTLLSALAILLLPRQFHVAVVENTSEQEIRTASWLFPLYLVLINLFVIPIAIAGLVAFPPGFIDGDMYVVTLPLSAGSHVMSLVAFVGGLSAATAMVIVETVALAVMVSNDIFMPLMVRGRRLRDAAEANRAAADGPPDTGADGQTDGHADMGRRLLTVRRIAIFAILLLAYLYYRVTGEAQLAQIGLLSFAAVAQFGPALLLGLVWRRGTALGALAGIAAGIALWAYTLLLPSLVDAGLFTHALLQEGPFGLSMLRPQTLLGVQASPLVHGVLWSLTINVLVFLAVSLMRKPTPIERLQASVFVESDHAPSAPSFRLWRSPVTVGELVSTVARYLGEERTRASFESISAMRGISLEPSREADFQLIRYAEHLLASAIGAASSRLVLSLMLRKRTVSTKAALKLLDDASAAIQYNREILQTALDHVRQGIAVFDRDLRLITWNRQFGEMLELPPEILRIGVSIDQIIRFNATGGQFGPGPVEEIVREKLDRYARRNVVFQERLTPRGVVMEVRVNTMPDGGVVVTFTDITPSVEAAEALERANETLERRVRERTKALEKLNTQLAQAKSEAEEANISKTRFLAAASHDILQPLNAARLYATSLVERSVAGEETRLARNVDASLEAVEEILAALLDISRLDAGALKPDIAPFRLDEIFQQLELEFAPMAKEKGLELTFVPSAAAVRSDRRLLRRLLQNLVSNAIKYTHKGRVLIGVRPRRGKLRVQVLDTGVGVPPGKQKLIFKEFQRLDEGAKAARGLGLGLSIVERIARVLDHPISLSSTSGKGSVFTVELPAAPAMPARGQPSPRPAAPVATLQGLSVLCIDNDPAILDGMETLLTGWGCEVLKAPGLTEALAMLREHRAPPDVLLIDYHLDKGDGIDAAKQLRWKLGHSLPAVLITADRSKRVRDTARATEMEVLNKPVRPAALRALLAACRATRAAAE